MATYNDTNTTQLKNQVVLNWPPRVLSPNARVHWSVRSRAARKYRSDCYNLAKQANLQSPSSVDGKIYLLVNFYPPDRRKRDDDNMIASFKSARDGIADALGINDNCFISHPFISDDIGGFIRVILTDGL